MEKPVVNRHNCPHLDMYANCRHPENQRPWLWKLLLGRKPCILLVPNTDPDADLKPKRYCKWFPDIGTRWAL